MTSNSKIVSSLMALGVLSLMGCGKAPEAQPTISVNFASFTAQNRVLDFFLPSAYAATSNLVVCFKRLRLKTESNSAAAVSGGDLDFQVGEVSLASSKATKLSDVAIPAGLYKRIEFDLAKDGLGCTSGKSVQFSNSNGTYSSNDTITIKFESSAGFDATSSGQILALGLQGVIDALNTISGSSGVNSSIKTALEGTSVKGSF